MVEIPFSRTRDGIRIEVKVEPRSSRKGLSGTMGNIVKIKLTAPPVGGAANKQLIEVISEATGIKKSSISIVKGLSSKRKIVEIRGVNTL
jgi:uncharacterized protein (TIGR00251 family)